MNVPFAIDALGATHDRRGFSCGVDALDRYFRTQVTQDIRRRLTNCFVATDPAGLVAGFYTLSATSIPLTDLPEAETKRLPHYPVLPSGLIGRLAVSDMCHGQGLGAALIVDAIRRTLRAAPAIFALGVDAKDENAARFYAHLGFQRFVSREMSLFLPLAAVAKALHRP